MLLISLMMLLPPATKLGQGNVFTGVCDSVNGRGGAIPACIAVGIPACLAAGLQGGLLLGGAWSGGVCSWGGVLLLGGACSGGSLLLWPSVVAFCYAFLLWPSGLVAF